MKLVWAEHSILIYGEQSRHGGYDGRKENEMTKTDIVRQLMEITHEITTEIEKEAETPRSYNADEVMDLLNYFAEKLIDLRLQISK